MMRIAWLTLLACALVGPADAAEPYEQLPPKRAEVVNSTAPDAPIQVSGQPDLLTASTSALGKCQQTFGATGYCEVTKVGAIDVTTAAALKSAAPAARHPLYLWRYDSPTATVYLAGSVHIMKQGLYPLPDQFDRAFDAADKLVLEVDIGKYSATELQTKTFEYGLLGRGESLRANLEPKLYAALEERLAQYGLPLAQLDMLKPAVVAQQLVQLALVSMGYDPTIGIEQHYVKRAAGKEILELESLEFQLDLLFNLSMDAQVQMVQDAVVEFDELESIFSQIMAAWFAGDDAAIKESLEASTGTSQIAEDLQKRLNDDRNVGMAAKVTEYLEGSGTYFVLAGAAHLVGPNSIVEVLRRQDIEGRRIYSTDTL